MSFNNATFNSSDTISNLTPPSAVILRGGGLRTSLTRIAMLAKVYTP